MDGQNPDEMQVLSKPASSGDRLFAWQADAFILSVIEFGPIPCIFAIPD